MRRHAPDGKPHPADAYVFGDGGGRTPQSIKRAWEWCVLKAYGIKPARVKGERRMDSNDRALFRTFLRRLGARASK